MSANPAAFSEDDLRLRIMPRREYDELVEQGWYQDEKIELLEGVLVEVSPEGTDHTWIIQQLLWLLVRNLPGHLRVRAGNPFAAGDISEPEPDVAIVPDADYRRQHASKALLLIEVSKSSLRKDLGIKARIFGHAGVPEYWVIDLEHEIVHVHTGPTSDGYRHLEPRPFTDTLDACGVEVCLATLLEPPRA